ncbi:hypothetical protein B0H67DRAFT_648926 [Lasiosphaeris hirsuta]|uniref:Uncharacterized protein n=1 Tax=Lasiosphaeris hirsuta TaxID=260670 RepID=A0AA40DKC6_9PEZI|nr:hypothetical protein B0H67DRAFT_648926 [Lasiosphaeris hirsuta]
MGESALDKAMAKVAILLDICISTALAPWTSLKTMDATNSQLGSYALLLSVSTGLQALISGFTQLAGAADSAKKLVLLQERTITEQTESGSAHVPRDIMVEGPPEFGFANALEVEHSSATERQCSAVIIGNGQG